MSKKKIALVNVFFPPQSIGGATRVLVDNFNILVEQYKDNFELVIFTSDVDMNEKPHVLDVYTYKEIRVYRSSVIFRENMDWYPQDEEMGKIFERFLDFEKPDKIHFHCVQRLSASIVEVTLKNKIPYFITLHDAWWIFDFQFLVDEKGKVYPNGYADVHNKINLPKNISENISIQRKLYLLELLKGADKLLTVSKNFKAIYKKNGISNIDVIKNGISNNIKWNKKKTNYTKKVVCGHIGGMSEHKGYDILKKAASNIHLENIEFLIVDHSKEEEYILHEKWGELSVTYIGPVKQNKIASLYSRIDVLFAPSIWPESFGLVTREAAACGCWVVASNLGSIGEDIIDGKTGFIINPTVEELENILNIISKNREKYKSLAPIKKIRLASEQVKELVEYYNKNDK